MGTFIYYVDNIAGYYKVELPFETFIYLIKQGGYTQDIAKGIFEQQSYGIDLSAYAPEGQKIRVYRDGYIVKEVTGATDINIPYDPNFDGVISTNDIINSWINYDHYIIYKGIKFVEFEYLDIQPTNATQKYLHIIVLQDPRFYDLGLLGAISIKDKMSEYEYGIPIYGKPNTKAALEIIYEVTTPIEVNVYKATAYQSDIPGMHAFVRIFENQQP